MEDENISTQNNHEGWGILSFEESPPGTVVVYFEGKAEELKNGVCLRLSETEGSLAFEVSSTATLVSEIEMLRQENTRLRDQIALYSKFAEAVSDSPDSDTANLFEVLHALLKGEYSVPTLDKTTNRGELVKYRPLNLNREVEYKAKDGRIQWCSRLNWEASYFKPILNPF